jgi:hypothetical protein
MYNDPNALLLMMLLRAETSRFAAAHEDDRPTREGKRLRSRGEAPGERRPRRELLPSRGRVGRALLALAALAAAAASLTAVTTLGAEPASSVLLAAWRALGLGVFAGLFALVASAPERYPGVLELAILHQAALTLWAMGSGAPNATRIVAADGALALLLTASYLLLGAHRSWALRGSGRGGLPATRTGRPRARRHALPPC